MSDVPRVAVVGAGVSGLTAAYLLQRTSAVTLFEREDRLGGHAHTHEVPVGSDRARVDSGFIVLNDRTYPRLHRLFGELGVSIRPTEMSMGITCDGCGLAYVGGRGGRGIFAQKRRIADPRFLRLLAGVRRFQRTALAHLATEADSLETFGEFLTRHQFGRHFVTHYALPVVACVWSSGSRDALDYPAAYLFEFLSNHGFLAVRDAPQWYVVEGGSASYVEKIRSRLSDVRRGDPVRSVARDRDGISVIDGSGAHAFDRVVLATHADEALALLSDPTDNERDVLGEFGYSTNTTQLHRDDSILPERHSERASWNLRMSQCDEHSDQVRVTYWMNRLQGHPVEHPLLVSLNDADGVDPSQVIATTCYTHPLFTASSVAAQRRLPSLNTGRTAYAGSYHGWGFHEDGCRAGVAAARHFGATW